MNKSLLIPIVLFISFLIFTYLVMPVYGDLAKAKQNLEERELELRNAENYYERIQENFDNLRKNEENLAKIDSALPSAAAPSAVANFLQLASSESGVFLDTISVRTPNPESASKKGGAAKEEGLPKGVQGSDASLNVSGYYDDFKNFIAKVEGSARLIEVEGFSLTAPEAEGVPSAGLSLKFYSY